MNLLPENQVGHRIKTNASLAKNFLSHTEETTLVREASWDPKKLKFIMSNQNP